MSEAVLQFLWYLIFLVVVCGYLVLDGFDLGVGALHLMARGDRERRLFLNAIGPVWDGNEVWLVVLAGALFAGFPFAYATLNSAFYTLVMIFLAGLIFRAVAIEIRSKVENRVWRWIWDIGFSLASIVITLGLGFAIGNLIRGLELDEFHRFTGNFASFFHPYAILVAFTVLALCMMHGAIYLVMKTEGETHDHLRRWILPTILLFVVLYMATTIATLIWEPHMAQRFIAYPWLFFIPALNIVLVALVPYFVNHEWDGWAFLCSGAAVACFVALYALGTFPNIVRSVVDPTVNSLTLENAYASIKTLKILLIIVCIGIPLALAYIICVYYVFRGKVRLDETSY